MTLNSATLINKADRLYSDSGAEVIVAWIQSPISRQIFESGGQIVDEIYVQVKPFEVALPALDTLAQEFAAWDAASDEDLLNFEKENL
ncbi:MAG: hypothetical protein HZB19_13595 [Chloroflexi bacterium]|nr:hypothetical protein [Chloroflexota bacterium]